MSHCIGLDQTSYDVRQYFTLSGLSTDLGLLNNGITWAYTIGIITLGVFRMFILIHGAHMA